MLVFSCMEECQLPVDPKAKQSVKQSPLYGKQSSFTKNIATLSERKKFSAFAFALGSGLLLATITTTLLLKASFTVILVSASCTGSVFVIAAIALIVFSIKLRHVHQTLIDQWIGNGQKIDQAFLKRKQDYDGYNTKEKLTALEDAIEHAKGGDLLYLLSQLSKKDCEGYKTKNHDSLLSLAIKNLVTKNDEYFVFRAQTLQELLDKGFNTAQDKQVFDKIYILNDEEIEGKKEKYVSLIACTVKLIRATKDAYLGSNLALRICLRNKIHFSEQYVIEASNREERDLTDALSRQKRIKEAYERYKQTTENNKKELEAIEKALNMHKQLHVELLKNFIPSEVR